MEEVTVWITQVLENKKFFIPHYKSPELRTAMIATYIGIVYTVEGCAYRKQECCLSLLYILLYFQSGDNADSGSPLFLNPIIYNYMTFVCVYFIKDTN